MKKFLHTITATSLLFLIGSANAQIDGNNNIAPNFQGYDIFGNSHDFYADYLDNNMPIILDVSAHWCPPCWSYHETHALRDLFDQYGPNGSIDDSTCMVFFADGDATSSFAELYNIGLTGSQSTQGDWVTGTTYPIFGGDTGIGANDGRDIANLYEINYFPTIFLIHPDRTVEEVGGQTLPNLIDLVQNANPIPTTTNDAQLKYIKPVESLCSGSNANIEYVIKNIGQETMTSATIEVEYDGSVIETVNWTGSIDQFEIETNTITLNDVQVGNHTLKISINDINGGTDDNVSNNSNTTNFSVSKSESSIFSLRLKTDSYGSETDWNIRNGSNSIVARKSDFKSGSYGNNQTFTHEITLDVNDCYKLILLDSYGDGGAEITLKDETNSTIASISADFEDEATSRFERFNDFGLSVSANLGNDLSIFPNPVKDKINIKLNTNSQVSYQLVNILGQNIESKKLGFISGTQTIQINTSDLEEGVYLLTVTLGDETITERIIK